MCYRHLLGTRHSCDSVRHYTQRGSFSSYFHIWTQCTSICTVLHFLLARISDACAKEKKHNIFDSCASPSIGFYGTMKGAGKDKILTVFSNYFCLILNGCSTSRVVLLKVIHLQIETKLGQSDLGKTIPTKHNYEFCHMTSIDTQFCV